MQGGKKALLKLHYIQQVLHGWLCKGSIFLAVPTNITVGMSQEASTQHIICSTHIGNLHTSTPINYTYISFILQILPNLVTTLLMRLMVCSESRLDCSVSLTAIPDYSSAHTNTSCAMLIRVGFLVPPCLFR